MNSTLAELTVHGQNTEMTLLCCQWYNDPSENKHTQHTLSAKGHQFKTVWYGHYLYHMSLSRYGAPPPPPPTDLWGSPLCSLVPCSPQGQFCTSQPCQTKGHVFHWFFSEPHPTSLLLKKAHTHTHTNFNNPKFGNCTFTYFWNMCTGMIHTTILYYTGCLKKSGTLDFLYFEIRKYSILWFHQIKHCLLKRMMPRSFDLVR